MKILILGAAGFLGRNLYSHYLADYKLHELTAVDNMAWQLESPTPPFCFIKDDICNLESMKAVVKDKDVIIQCVAQTSHPLSMSDPIFDADVNCIGNLSILEAVRESNPKTLVIFPSSSTVVGPEQEKTRENPLDIYSANKLAAEKYYEIYNKVHGLRTIILRLPNLFGPYGKASPAFGFVNYFISLALAGKEICVYGDGSQLRNVLYIKDVFSLFDFAIKNSSKLMGKPIIVGSDMSLSVGLIAKAVADVFGTSVKKVPWPAGRKKIEIGDVKINNWYIKSLGWSPKYTLYQGLEDML